MGAVWRDDSAYLALVDAKRHPKYAGLVSDAPRTSPAPSSSDVAYVNDLADEFEWELRGPLDGWVDDSPDGPEWAIVAGAAIVGTGFVLGLGALCIIGAVAVARWLGWVG